MMPPKEEWIPQWKNRKEYPSLEAPLCLFAWEFVRRNPAYRNLWLKLIKPRGERESFIYNDFSLDEENKRFEVEFGMLSTPPPWLSSKDAGLFPRFVSAFQIEIKPSSDWPEEDEGSYYPRLGEEELSLYLALVRFDLRLPLERQFEEVKKLLAPRIKEIKMAKEFKAPRARGKYIDYLRLLDAQEVGATHSDMAKEIYPKLENKFPNYNGNKRVADNMKVAKRLRDHDYRLLAATGNSIITRPVFR